MPSSHPAMKTSGNSRPFDAWLWWPTVASVIIGARDDDQLRDNLGAVGWSLTAAQVAPLDAASATTPIYPYWHQWQLKERNPTSRRVHKWTRLEDFKGAGRGPPLVREVNSRTSPHLRPSPWLGF